MEIGRTRLGQLVTGGLLVIWTIFTLFPLYWMLITSLGATSSGSRPTFLPFIDFQPTMQPWLNIFGLGRVSAYDVDALDRFRLFAMNSVVVALVSTTLAIMLGTALAYGLARFRFGAWNNDKIAFWFISWRVLPPIALATPYFILFNYLDLIDSLLTLILVYAAMNLPLVVWIMRDYYRALPVEIEESALLDGCTPLGVFWRIALPLSMPGLVVAFLVSFVFAWNEFIYAFTLTFGDAKTLTVYLAGARGTEGKSALSGVMLLPPLVIAMFTTRYIIRGLAKGAFR